jgi:hypothetical protein
MKKILFLLLGVPLCLLTSAVESHATSLSMFGTYSYSYYAPSYYYSFVSQTGRYSSLGSGYYRSGTIRVGRIQNNNFSGRSGTLSFEFWGMPYYNANSGYTKFTRRLSPLYAGYGYSNVVKSGWMKHYGYTLYPELNLFEYTTSGWLWKRELKFSSSRAL